MNWESVVIGLIVGAAALYLAQWFYRSLFGVRGKSQAPACESCPSCAEKKPEEGKAHNS